jgi:hypothetical protein
MEHRRRAVGPLDLDGEARLLRAVIERDDVHLEVLVARLPARIAMQPLAPDRRFGRQEENLGAGDASSSKRARPALKRQSK